MAKPRAQFLNEYTYLASRLEEERLTTERTGELSLGAIATAEVTHAYAVQAMSRSNGSIRGKLEAISMVALRNAGADEPGELTLKT